MKKPILIGQAQYFTVVELNQVWVDAAGTIAVVVSETPEGFLLQIGPRTFEVLPKNHQSHFQETCTYLGEL